MARVVIHVEAGSTSIEIHEENHIVNPRSADSHGVGRLLDQAVQRARDALGLADRTATS